MEKTGDKTVDSMFGEIVETKISSDGKLEVVALAPDAEQEKEDAVADMVKSWKDFKDANGDYPIAVWGYQWWRALMHLSLAEDRLKEAFLGRDRSPASVKQYHKWRLKMIDGRRYRTDA
jgi:hypothetical protein